MNHHLVTMNHHLVATPHLLFQPGFQKLLLLIGNNLLLPQALLGFLQVSVQHQGLRRRPPQLSQQLFLSWIFKNAFLLISFTPVTGSLGQIVDIVTTCHPTPPSQHLVHTYLCSVSLGATLVQWLVCLPPSLVVTGSILPRGRFQTKTWNQRLIQPKLGTRK